MIIIQPVRVLHCFGRLNRGGAETLIMNIYRNIDRKAVQFDFVVHTRKKCEFDDEIESLGGRIFSVPRYNVANHLGYKKAWIRLFKEHGNEWEFVHGHLFTTAAIYLKIAKEHGLITVAHSHSTSSGSGLNGFVKDMIQKPLKGNLADYRFACSKTAGAWLFGVGNLSKVLILNNAIDAQKFSYNEAVRNQLRKDLGVDQCLVIGHVGTFYEPKNHMFLIDIFKEIHNKDDSAVLLLVGRGHMEKQIKDKVRGLGLQDSVKFMGVRSDVSTLMQVMDVFILPSLFEGLPVTVIEAQAAGLPCILSDSITNEVKITELVRFISLKEAVGKWAEAALSCLIDFERKSTLPEITKAGYDVEFTARWLQDFYLSNA